MTMRKRLFAVCATLAVTAGVLSVSAKALPEEKLDGEISRDTKVLYDGVTQTHISLGADSEYGRQEMWFVEFDPKQGDLAIDVTNQSQYSNKLITVEKTIESFAENNEGEKVPLVGINGDLWMVSYAHARVEGKGTNYNGYSDAVVTKSLTLPRGLNIYNGEIITGPHTPRETPFEGQMNSFAITSDGSAFISTPTLVIKLSNKTQNSATQATGLNRLPADNAIMVYSDRGCPTNNSLSDAYEIVLDCDDYIIKNNSVIKGKVVSIHAEGDENPKISENKIILCARGKNQVKKLSAYNIGDEVELSFIIKDSDNGSDAWNEVVNATGGNMILVKDGKPINLAAQKVNYPCSIIGTMKDGNVFFLTNDGRQGKDYSQGLLIKDMPELLVKWGVTDAMLLDGGGSATMVTINEDGGYDLTNRPCDKDENGNYGQARTVVNSVILSYIPQEEATPEPETEDSNAEEPTEELTSDNETSEGCSGVMSENAAMIIILSAGVMIFIKRKKIGKLHDNVRSIS